MADTSQVSRSSELLCVLCCVDKKIHVDFFFCRLVWKKTEGSLQSDKESSLDGYVSLF